MKFSDILCHLDFLGEAPEEQERIDSLRSLLERNVPFVSPSDARSLDEFSKKIWEVNSNTYAAYRLTSAVNYEACAKVIGGHGQDNTVRLTDAYFSYEKASNGLKRLALKAQDRGEIELSSQYAEMATRCRVRACNIIEGIRKKFGSSGKYDHDLEFSQKKIMELAELL